MTHLFRLLAAWCWLCLLGGAALAAPAPQPAADPVSRGLASTIDAMRQAEAFAIGSERIVARSFITYYYTQTGFTPIWTSGPGAWSALEEALHDLPELGLDPLDFHARALASLNLLIKTADEPSTQLLVDFEVLATDAVYLLVNARRRGKAGTQALLAGGERAQLEVVKVAGEGLYRALQQGSLLDAIRQQDPQAFFYAGYQRALARYREIAANGGWPPVPEGRVLRRGDRGRGIIELRRRLHASGDFAADPDVRNPEFDYDLETAVRNFQGRHGMAVDGVVGRGTLAALNMPLELRIDQIRANLERARWVGRVDPAAALLMINLNGDTVDWAQGQRMRRVGRLLAGPLCQGVADFSAELTGVEFNPAWMVPPATLRRELLPALRRNPGALQAGRFTVLTRAGEPVEPADVDWGAAGGDDWPYVVVQRPGPLNALGRVVFEFPNPQSVSLHDGPGAFAAPSGQPPLATACLRAEYPLQLAELVLAGSRHYDAEGIAEAVESGVTRTVAPPRPVTVVAAHWTVLVDDADRVHFLPDPGGRDAAILAQLDEPLSPPPAVRRPAAP